MRIRFLGTAAAEGVPALFCTCDFCAYARRVRGREVRSRAGSLVDGVLKLDFGPDSFRHMIDNRLDYTFLRALLVTHAHEDHLCPDDLFYRRPGFANLPEGIAPLTVYGNARVGERLRPHLGAFLRFEQLRAFETAVIEGYAVTPLEAVHCIDENSRRFPVVFEGKTYYRSEEAFFYLIEKDGESLLYAHDTDAFTPADLDFLAGRQIDLISLDCTNAARDAQYVGHMGSNDNLRLREKLLENGAADAHTTFVANHFSHNGLAPYDELVRLMPGFTIACDSLELPVRGE
jgi:phosphoribosyl 1,2-cyclic phosphate phosphodiesterase